MGQRSSRVRSFLDSEQVHDPNPSSSSSSTAEEQHPHWPVDVAEGEGAVIPNSRPKKKKKKGGNFFKWLSFSGKKKSTENKSSDQGEMKDQDIETETPRTSTDDQKSLQSISRSVEVTDLEEPPVGVIRVLPAAEPLEFQELQTQVHDAPAGETSPLTKPLDSNEVNMRPEDNICCRYAIGRKLGQGGFGAVYEGTRLADGHQVAVKFVKKTKHTECISIPDHPEPLPKEVALTILANKGPVKDIIELLDWQDQQDFYVMVLERLSHSMDVSRLVQGNGGSIDENFARLIIWGATLAAEACCRRGVYHGDIKLENLLIDLKNLEVKLIDFGCGDLLTESAYTRFCGTIMYCPPEYRMKGEFHGKPATVWTLGILLFRMLCGYFPDTFDLYRINMNTWYKPGLTEGNLFITSSSILMLNFIGFIGDGCIDNAGICLLSDLKILE
ncbi:serine/threonine-protein kinase pim-3-like isoform X2 [Megalobrama amblycephala]|uniref:serine/threonine-protein kinase pim-3-like isoform X2 n=1 Tax=Megalobrama amblycephala TaxID=75352 RepID=UPI002013CBD2|nr:serine/threonine-protein kinase pim-3-like isoform X2 [Megalobrama amblycephala]